MSDSRTIRILDPRERKQQDGEYQITKSFIIYFSPNIIWIITVKMGWVVHVACMDMRHLCKFLVRNPEGKRPLR